MFPEIVDYLLRPQKWGDRKSPSSVHCFTHQHHGVQNWSPGKESSSNKDKKETDIINAKSVTSDFFNSAFTKGKENNMD